MLASAGAILFSGKAIVAKLLYREGIDAVSLIALRMLLAAPFFVAIAFWTWRQQPVLSRADLFRITLLGLMGYYLSSFLDFLGLQYISAGLERLILFLTPSFVLLLNLWWFKRKVTSSEWLSFTVAYCGIALVFWHDMQIARHSHVVFGGNDGICCSRCLRALPGFIRRAFAAGRHFTLSSASNDCFVYCLCRTICSFTAFSYAFYPNFTRLGFIVDQRYAMYCISCGFNHDGSSAYRSQ
jgi:hypothetical protein